MLVMTYSAARQNLASTLDRAKKDGAVIITRTDGSKFRLTPEKSNTSPFEGIGTTIKLKNGELSAALQAAREDTESRF